jgi:hypothetical protein
MNEKVFYSVEKLQTSIKVALSCKQAMLNPPVGLFPEVKKNLGVSETTFRFLVFLLFVGTLVLGSSWSRFR